MRMMIEMLMLKLYNETYQFYIKLDITNGCNAMTTWWEWWSKCWIHNYVMGH